MPPRKKDVFVEEPLEAQPPAGVVLEEPVFVGEATDAEMRRLMEAAHKVVDEVDVEEDVSIEVVVEPQKFSVKPGMMVSYVLNRDVIEDMKSKGVAVNSLVAGDVSPALIIKCHVDGSVDLRVFVDAEDFPLRRGVKCIPQPDEVTWDHINYFYLEK